MWTVCDGRIVIYERACRLLPKDPMCVKPDVKGQEASLQVHSRLLEKALQFPWLMQQIARHQEDLRGRVCLFRGTLFWDARSKCQQARNALGNLQRTAAQHMLHRILDRRLVCQLKGYGPLLLLGETKVVWLNLKHLRLGEGLVLRMTGCPVPCVHLDTTLWQPRRQLGLQVLTEAQPLTARLRSWAPWLCRMAWKGVHHQLADGRQHPDHQRVHHLGDGPQKAELHQVNGIEEAVVQVLPLLQYWMQLHGLLTRQCGSEEKAMKIASPPSCGFSTRTPSTP